MIKGKLGQNSSNIADVLTPVITTWISKKKKKKKKRGGSLYTLALLVTAWIWKKYEFQLVTEIRLALHTGRWLYL